MDFRWKIRDNLKILQNFIEVSKMVRECKKKFGNFLKKFDYGFENS